MEKLLKYLSAPFTWFVNRGALAFLLSIIFVALIVWLNSTGTASFPTRVAYWRLTSSGEAGAMLALTTAIVFLLLLALLTTTRLRSLNSVSANHVSALFVLLLLGLFNWELALVLLSLLLLLWLLGRLAGYDTVFFEGASEPWKGRFARSSELADYGFKQMEGVILGVPEEGKKGPEDFIRFKGEANFLCFSPAGKGKSSGPVMANALTYDGSMVINDPKGEITLRSLFARLNGLGQTIKIIDPFGECHKQAVSRLGKIERLLDRCDRGNHPVIFEGLSNAKKFYTAIVDRLDPDGGDLIAGINPMQVINELFDAGEYERIYAEANVLADTLVVRTGSEKDPHWDEKARMVIRNAILFVTFSEVYQGQVRTLVTVREFIFRTFSDRQVLAVVLQQCSQSLYSKYLRHIIGEFKLIGDEELNGVLSNVLRHTEFIDDPFVTRSLSAGGWRLSELKKERMTVYLVLPLGKMTAYSRLARLWIATIIQAMIEDMQEPEKRVLLLLDEVAQLGRVEFIENGISYLRQYGINLYLIFQDLGQLRSIYGERSESIIANSRFRQFFGVSDPATAEYVSKETGQRTLVLRNTSFSEGKSYADGSKSSSTTEGFSTSVQAEPVIRPEEVRRSPLQFIISDGTYPIRARRCQYFSDDFLSALLPFTLPQNLKDI